MSGWGLGWFGGGSAQAKKNAPKNAILNLRSQLDMLQKREKHLQAQVEEAEEKARKFIGKDRDMATAALRRKRDHAQALEQNGKTMRTLEQQINAIESANITATTFKSLKEAADVLTKIQADITPEKVDKVKDQLDQAQGINEEFNNIISTGLDEDPEGMDEELARMEQEEKDKQVQDLTTKMLNTGSVPVSDQIHQVPAVPTGDINSERRRPEDDELAELAKAMELPALS